jgi:hypothetical protein
MVPPEFNTESSVFLPSRKPIWSRFPDSPSIYVTLNWPTTDNWPTTENKNRQDSDRDTVEREKEAVANQTRYRGMWQY